jgi:hypothetical protein
MRYTEYLHPPAPSCLTGGGAGPDSPADQHPPICSLLSKTTSREERSQSRRITAEAYEGWKARRKTPTAREVPRSNVRSCGCLKVRKGLCYSAQPFFFLYSTL